MSRTALWKRLYQHRGAGDGGGNHRGSVFRHLCRDIADRQGRPRLWDKGNSVSAEIRAGEKELECEVSRVLGSLPFLWLAIDDVS
jgi:hypothetical protein